MSIAIDEEDRRVVYARCGQTDEGYYDVLVRNYQTATGTWSGWENLNVGWKSAIVARDINGDIIAYLISSDYNIYESHQNAAGAWSPWRLIYRSANAWTILDASMDYDGKLNVFFETFEDFYVLTQSSPGANSYTVQKIGRR